VPLDGHSDSIVMVEASSRPYTLYGGFAVFRAMFPWFNKYRTNPPDSYSKWSFATDLGKISEKNDLFYEHDSIKKRH